MIKFKAFVLCLKLLTCLIVQRSFGNVVFVMKHINKFSTREGRGGGGVKKDLFIIISKFVVC